MSIKQDHLAVSQPHERQFDVLTSSEAKDLLHAVAADPTAALVNDIVTVILNTGLRVGELRQLAPSDVNFESRTLAIGPSKAVGTRLVPFNTEVSQVLSGLINASTDDKAVFGEGAVNAAARKLTKISKRTLGRALTFHTLRRTFVMNVLRAGMSLDALMYMCGWKCAASPFKHLGKVTSPQIARAYQEAMKKGREDN
jgi:integrase